MQHATGTSHISPSQNPYRVAVSVQLSPYNILLLSPMSFVHIRQNSEVLSRLGQVNHIRRVLHPPLSSDGLDYRLGKEASPSSHVTRESSGWHPTIPRRRWAFRNWRASLFSSEVIAEHLPVHSCTQFCEHAAACTGSAATTKSDCIRDTTWP